MVKTRYAPDRGDIVWLDFEPVKGHEQRGSRPAFVVSPRAYNVKTGLLLACPITSKSKGYPFEVPCEVAKVSGVVLADRIRSLDWKARHARHVATAPPSVTEGVEQRLLLLIRS